MAQYKHSISRRTLDGCSRKHARARVRTPVQASERRWRPCFTSGRDRTGYAILLDPSSPVLSGCFVVVRLFGIRLVGPDVAISVPSPYLRALCASVFRPCARMIPVLETGVSALKDPDAISSRCYALRPSTHLEVSRLCIRLVCGSSLIPAVCV